LLFPLKGNEMSNERGVVKSVKPLGFPWETQDPFLFCVFHSDAYPRGNNKLGPRASLDGRNLGNDFVLKDGWRMYHGTTVPGFPVHPHRGFETVTVVRKGIVDHSDSLGGAGRYGHGDVQWMTTGKGIQHAEMFPLLNQDRANPLELFQIWINLPGESKFVEPYYSMLWGEQIPVWAGTDPFGGTTTIEIVAGSLGSLTAPAPAPDSWAADQSHDVAIWTIKMEPGARWVLPQAPEGTNRSLYFFDGGSVEINGESIMHHCILELKTHRTAELVNGPIRSRFLLLQGKPIGEPVVSHGPFVMNTRSEIQQTYVDYQETRFGGWPWPRHDQVHGRDRGRFALYSDGREEFPPGQ
jgi:redox-sensitive bicupin YhaK (pirin superfamily)